MSSEKLLRAWRATVSGMCLLAGAACAGSPAGAQEAVPSAADAPAAQAVEAAPQPPPQAAAVQVEPAEPEAPPASTAPEPIPELSLKDAPVGAAPELTQELAQEGQEAEDPPLPSPTENFEAYEDARLNRYRRIQTPRGSFGLTLAWRAFTDADFRVPKPTTALPGGRIPSRVNPAIRGLLMSGERVLFRSLGNLSIGLEGGLYGSRHEDGYGSLVAALISAGPYLSYQLELIDRQWVVPYGRVEAENILQNYSYEGGKNNAISQILRADVGAMIYLNFLEHRSAGHMNANYGVKRTYLVGTWTFANDLTKKNLTLSEQAWRAGFRFEY